MSTTPSLKALVATLKCQADDPRTALQIPVADGGTTYGFLSVMPSGPLLTDDLIHAITDARNREPDGFASRFKATKARTQWYLTRTICADSSRLLFLGRSVEGKLLAEIGLMNLWRPRYTAEFDNLIRLAPDVPGFMTRAFGAMIAWARAALNLRAIVSYPLTDNLSTMSFHRRVGFTLRDHLVLHEVARADESHWVTEEELPGYSDASRTGRTRVMARGFLLLHRCQDNQITALPKDQLLTRAAG